MTKMDDPILIGYAVIEAMNLCDALDYELVIGKHRAYAKDSEMVGRGPTYIEALLLLTCKLKIAKDVLDAQKVKPPE